MLRRRNKRIPPALLRGFLARLSLAIVAACSISAFFSNTAHSDEQPLFAESAPLAITLSLPLYTLLNGQTDTPLNGSVQLGQGDRETTLDVQVSARGHSRRDFCDMPPLKLNFRRGQLEGTVFAGQNKLKLVSQCKDEKKYQRYLLQEYAIYRAYQSLTAESFQVRQLELTLMDTDDWYSPRQRMAFLIEADTLLAARLDATEVSIPQIPPETYDPNAVTRVSLFHYLMGNTDWSILKGRGEAPCCHNGVVLERPDGTRIVVPYDFDQAGLISTEYAIPAQGLPIGRVRSRLYRGLCTGDDRLAAAIGTFNEHRSEIEAEFPAEGLLRSSNKRNLKYIGEFYRVINDPKRLQGEIVDQCRGTAEHWE